MWRYPDGTIRQTTPARLEYAGFIRDFTNLTPAQRDELGYNEAVPLTRDRFTVYETEWAKGEDLIFREALLSAVVDEAARDAALAGEARTERDRLLGESDWTQLADSPLGETAKTDWADYRQALRDLPEQAGFPGTPEWPEPPVI